MEYEEDIKKAASTLESLLETYKSRFEKIAKDIINACDVIEKSWSQSWLGYHANLYFGDYKQPSSPKERFSVEWGGIYGYDSRWQPRELDEVWKYVLSQSSIKFDLDKTNDELNELQEASKALKTLYELNPKSAVLEEKVKKIDADYVMYDFIKARKPGSFVSRDSEAIYQGIKVPPHIQCQAFAHAIRQNISAAEQLLKLKGLLLRSTEVPTTVQVLDNELSHLNPKLTAKVGKLFADNHYPEAVGMGFRMVKDRLRDITGFENGFPAFDEGGLYIKGSAADNVDADFQEGVRRLLGSIDKFRNEKFHTSEANLKDKDKALSYLHLCSLALSFLEDGNYSIKRTAKK